MRRSTMEIISLAESLEGKSVSELRMLARGYAIKGASKMRKADLLQAVHDELTRPQRLEELLYILSGPAWVLFCQAVESEGAVEVPPQGTDASRMLADLGYLHLFEASGPVMCVVPTEIKGIFRSLAEGGFLKRKARYDLLHQYAEAAVNLYGVIRQEDFITLFNSQNSPPTTEEEVFAALIRHIAVDTGYCFWEEYLVDTDFEMNDFSDVPDLLDQVGDKPRYIPDREEFLKYSNWEYFEHNAEYGRLELYLTRALGVVPMAVPQLIAEVHYACVVEAGFQKLFAILADHGVHPDSCQLDELTQLIAEFTNATRLWSNNGHTPNEIFELYQRDRMHQIPAQGKASKIGRNDPCPCGSGKKYKKCCGR